MQLIIDNLLTPPVLAFVLGFLATTLKGNLRLPEQASSFLAMFLLLAIGLKGGEALRASSIDELWKPTIATLLLGLATPLIAFAATRALPIAIDNRASLAAHYGSVSVVTFTAAVTYVESSDGPAEGFLPTLVAMLEIPGIIVALMIAGRAAAKASGNSPQWRPILHEVLSGKSIMLLVGGMVIGAIATPASLAKTDPLMIDLFYGALALYLLDLGSLAASHLSSIFQFGTRLVGVAVGVPIVNGTLGVVAGSVSGLSTSGAAVLGVMAASASYIAAPAAVQLALPKADLSMALTASLAITFPFNLALGIPLFDAIARGLT
jgi:uncharacterized protein